MKRPLGALILAIGLIATSCSTTQPTAVAAPTPVPEPTAVPAPTPVPEPTPNAAPTPVPEPTPNAAPTPVPEPTPDVDRVEIPADMRILGMSDDGRFAYGNLSDWFDSPTACDGEPSETLASIDISESIARDEVVATSAGLNVTGDIRSAVFSTGGLITLLVSCIDGGGKGGDVKAFSFVQATIDDNGVIASVGEPIEFDINQDQESSPWLVTDSTAERFALHTDDRTEEGWGRTYERTIDFAAGTVGEPVEIGEQSRWRESFDSPDGRHTYRVIVDPAGSLGCEGVVPAVTFEVDDGQSRRLALGADGLTFVSILSLEFGPDGLVVWQTGCEGRLGIYAGRQLPDGMIVDVHRINVQRAGGDDFHGADRLRHARFTDDGFLVAVGFSIGEADFLRIDMNTDPGFVETGPVPPVVDTSTPLGTTLYGAEWYVGESRALEPACGSSTLYLETSTGLTHGFNSWADEIDLIVEIDVSEPYIRMYGTGTERRMRTVVFSTECAAEYDGRRVWYTDESEDSARWGLWTPRVAFNDQVAEVLSIYESEEPRDDYGKRMIIEVLYLDGTVGEVEVST